MAACTCTGKMPPVCPAMLRRKNCYFTDSYPAAIGTPLLAVPRLAFSRKKDMRWP